MPSGVPSKPELDGELDDVAASPTAGLRSLDRHLLTSPLVVRAIGVIVIASAGLIWPDRTDRILARLLGAAFLWLAASTAWSSVRERSFSLRQVVTVVASGAIGGFLLIAPDQSKVTIGRLLSATIIIMTGAAFLTRRSDPEKRPGATRMVVAAVASVVLFAFPSSILTAVTVALAFGLIAVSMVVITAALDGDSSGVSSEASMSDVALGWLTDRHKSADARQELYDKILFDGPNQQRRFVRFFTLMAFASIIAAMGVITDSTAVVIGAMLIAPLMTPLMAMAVSLVMGWPNRLGMALLVATAGILLAIGIGVLLGLVVPGVISTETNTQILARSTPTLLDLIIALAAGAAGAYGLSRPDVSDSLPGVAIAIALVPPLSVVGVAYSQADWTAGNGALLLFMTNMLAILTMGGITFVLTGVTPLSVAYEGQRRVRTALVSVGLLALIVFGGLLLNGAQIASDALNETRLSDAVTEWLDDAPLHRLIDTEVEDDLVTVVVVGPIDGLADVDVLAADLTQAFGRSMTADVRIIVEERVRSDD
jgi:uncharacterized hydrophobic protein (TIGR00271 family)